MTDDICGVTTTQDQPCQNPAGENGFCWISSHNPGTDEENPHGRDPKLTQERQEKIASAIEAGKSVVSAARMAGIHPATIYSWLEKGEDQDEGIYGDFHDRFVRARGQGEDTYVEALIDIARDQDDTATLMSMLKQRYPESWGDVDRGEQSGQVVVNTEAPETTEIDPDSLEVKE